jgi:hypothetical protein
MAEANRLLSALEEAIKQLDRLSAVCPSQVESLDDLQLSCICSPVGALLDAFGSKPASQRETSAGQFISSNVVCRLVSFLGNTFRAAGKYAHSPHDTSSLQSTWEKALIFLQDLALNCPTELLEPWLTQLLDAGMTHGSRHIGL